MKFKLKTIFGIAIMGSIIICLSVGMKKSHLVTIRFDKVPLKVEAVSSPSDMERGLMYRKKLPENQGMLFVFKEPDYCSFWMKNTYIPLSIAFISENRIVTQIEDMVPFDTVNFHISKKLSKYAVEANKGWFRRHKVKVGERVWGIPF